MIGVGQQSRIVILIQRDAPEAWKVQVTKDHVLVALDVNVVCNLDSLLPCIREAVDYLLRRETE